jgi:uncharacterized membrane protein YfhO
MSATLEPVLAGAQENVRFQSYEADRLELAVHAESRGLLVLSEVYDPGWHVTVNGQPAPMQEVDGALRGVVVGSGDNKITLRYLPASVLAGAILTAFAFLGVPLAWFLISRQRRHA